MTKVNYEAQRLQNMEANNKRMQALHLPLLTKALNKASTPKDSSKIRKSAPRVARTKVVSVRRSLRFENKPAPEYREITVYDRVHMPRRATPRRRDLTDRVFASAEAREYALGKADEVEASLGTDYPTYVREMLPSHISGGFWLGIPKHAMRRMFPKVDCEITLVDEEGGDWPVIFLHRKCGLSGGWKGFAQDHDLQDGDAVVFQKIGPTKFKVYISRTEDANNTDEMNEADEPKAD